MSGLMICLMILTTFTSFSADAYAKSKNKKKTSQHREAYTPPNAAILMDADTGMVLYQKDADRSLYPASLTKLMTLLLTFEALETRKITLHSPVVMTSHAASMPPSKLGIRPGRSITVDQAIKALVTKSANDIAVATGETLGGSEGRFAQLMNLKARELGMSQTHFVNASGLHNIRQKSSARDMAKLALHIIHNYPNYYPVFATQDFYFNGKSHHNHNRLMSSYRGMDGMKTGYIAPSGFNLVASAKRGNIRLVGVVFGGTTANSRNAQMASMLDNGFERAKQTHSTRPQIAANNNYTNPIELAPQPVKKAINNTATPQRSAPPIYAAPPAPPKKVNIETAQPILTSRVATPALSAAADPTYSGLAGGTWSIQIGAYQDRVSTDRAIYQAIQKLPAPLNRGNALVVPLRTAEATWVFRARISGYTKEQAIKACVYLEDCLTISPSSN